MNAISSAAPCHVRIGNVLYDVICWTVDPDGGPIPWINYDGAITSLYGLPFHLDADLRVGSAREAVEDGR